MAKVVLFNKPFNVLTQFRPDADRPDRQTLADFIHDPSLRVAGRLDMDSEGLLLLTDDGVLNARITQPVEKQFKTYWVQVDGIPTDAQLAALQTGVQLNDGKTLPAQAKSIEEPSIWPRNPPVRYRAHLPTSWLEIQICEGRNLAKQQLQLRCVRKASNCVKRRQDGVKYRFITPIESTPRHDPQLQTSQPALFMGALGHQCSLARGLVAHGL